MSDCLFIALIVWLFMAGSGWSVLLADGDTGWHIRTGEFILDQGTIPAHDIFSFSKPGQPWFAWEWLSDVCFGFLHRHWGLKGVVWLAGLVLAASATVLFRHMLWSGTNLFLSLALTLLASGASTIHYLARPHVFTFLLLAFSLWMLDRDRRQPSAQIGWLVPLTAVWTNLHGGFLALLVCLALVAAGSALEGLLHSDGARFRPARRYSLLLAACTLATIINPFGIRLHQHIAQYLRSDWILEAIDEFQAPKFRSENMAQFEIVLFIALALVFRLLQQKQFGRALLLVFWGQAALRSVRHVPIFAIVAAPIVARELETLWARFSESRQPGSLVGILRSLAREFSYPGLRTSLWPPVLAGLLLFTHLGQRWPLDFPGNKFPTRMAARHADLLAPASGPRPRVLSTDQWGDYLLYRFYPGVRVFVDGRSDFYGPSIGQDYLRMANAQHQWEALVEGYGFDLALIPPQWALAELLKRDGRWRMVEDDGAAILFERRQRATAVLNKSRHSAETLAESSQL